MCGDLEGPCQSAAARLRSFASPSACHTVLTGCPCHHLFSQYLAFCCHKPSHKKVTDSQQSALAITMHNMYKTFAPISSGADDGHLLLCSDGDILEPAECGLEAMQQLQDSVHRWRPGMTFAEFAKATITDFYE